MSTMQSVAAGCREAAIQYRAFGWTPVALCPPDHAGTSQWHRERCANPGKSPLPKWKELQDRPATLDEIGEWWQRNLLANVGILLGPVSGLVRIDVDGPAGDAMLREMSRGELPATLEFTRYHADGSLATDGRGLLYAIPPGVTLKTTPHRRKGCGDHQELRLQANGAQTVVPPSRHADGSQYRWKPGHAPDEIDAAPMPHWLIEAMKQEPPAAPLRTGPPPMGRDIERARRYVAKIDPAISGQGGHDKTFHVACCLVLGFNLPAGDAIALLREFNERCDPPWSEGELEHKISDANAKSGERGYLLNAERLPAQPVIRRPGRRVKTLAEIAGGRS